MQRALVLGAGGLAAIAWETGLLAGLERRGIDLAAADLVVGTSAGSTVAAQLGGLRDLDELVAAQLAPSTSEIVPDPDPAQVARRAAIWETLQDGGDPLAARRRMGGLALAAGTVTEAERRVVVEARLGGETWPGRPLLIPAVDARSGRRVVFRRDSGVALVDAVAASCAVPGTWPPVTIGSGRYVDGGVHSGTNVDLAAEAGSRLTVVLQVGDARPGDPGAADALPDRDRRRTLVLRPDHAFAEARGDDPLDPAVRPGCVRAGLAQAASLADEVGERWTAAVASPG